MSRTVIQVDADKADAALFRAYAMIEAMWDRYPAARKSLGGTLQSIREGRTPLRMLMSEADREKTV